MAPKADWYIVEGINPEPWEASEGTIGQRGGKRFIHFHKPAGLRQYQEAIADGFKRQNPHARMYEGEIFVHFFYWRDLYLMDMIEGRNRRAHPADTSNLNKGLEDALQGVLYKNDRTVRHISGTLVEQAADVAPCVLVAVWAEDTSLYRYASGVRQCLSVGGQVEHATNARGIEVEDIF